MSVREPVKKEKEIMSNIDKNKKTVESDRQTLTGDNFNFEKDDNSIFIITNKNNEEVTPSNLNENEIVQDDELSEINAEDIDFSAY